MKRFLLSVVLTLLLACGALAQTTLTQSTSVSAVTAYGGLFEQGQGVNVHHLSWFPGGTVPSTCTIAIDSSSDGVTYSAGGIMAGQTCNQATGGSFTVYGVSANYVRVNVTTLTGAGATFTYVYSGTSNTQTSGPIYSTLLSTGAITPAASSGAVQTTAQTFTLTGLNSGDQVTLISQPAPTSLCPPTLSRATGANTISIYFSTLTAAACTPAAGTYIFAVIR